MCFMEVTLLLIKIERRMEEAYGENRRHTD